MPGRKEYPYRWSRAPYNFVPLPERVFTVNDGVAIDGQDGVKPWFEQDRFLPGARTGWLDLTIRAETPLYVRCAPPAEQVAQEVPNCDAAEAFRRYRHRQDFFHHGDPERPVIPGSSLRGMTRALIEILAAGKLQWFTDRYLTYRAVAEPTSFARYYQDQFKRGSLRGGYLRLKDGTRAIQPAQTWNGWSFVRVDYDALPPTTDPHPPTEPYTRERDTVWVWIRVDGLRTRRNRPPAVTKSEHICLYEEGTDPPGPEYRLAVLVRSGDVPGKKWHMAIFAPDENAQPIPIPDRLWEQYQADLELSRDPHHIRHLSDGDPLFYLMSGDRLVFFGHTAMFRLPYAVGDNGDRTIARLIPPHLRVPEDLDLAEAMFGRVDPKPAFRGRVFFTDAVWDGQGGSPFLAPGDAGLRSPKVLAQPKPTAFQHYLEQVPDDRPSVFRHWDDAPSTTRVRGHKLYWHRREAEPFEPELQNDNLHTIIRPVRPGTVFCGRVYFENLSDLELGALLTALQLPPSKRHHLGMGKPLGMGSVRIEVRLHLVDPMRRYASLFGTDGGLETGELPETETAAIGEAARRLFERTMVAHYQAHASRADAARVQSLWEIPRLQDLARLLEWDEAPPAPATEYLPAPTEAEDGEGPTWRMRPVLPTPGQVYEGLAGHRRLVAASGGVQPITPRPGGTSRSEGMSRPGQRPRAAGQTPRARRGTHEGRSFLKAGDRVTCILEKDPQGRWRARTENGWEVEVIGTVPSDLKPGSRVEMVVVRQLLRHVEVRWPLEEKQGPNRK